jgi:hypothetical protein
VTLGEKKMKRIISTVVILLIVLSAVFVGGFALGLRDGLPKHAVEEFKMCHMNLTFNATNLTPQTREYLKSRLYWNAVVHIPANCFPEYQFDFGPVDDLALAGVDGIKDCSTSLEVYNAAMEKHSQKDKHPTKVRTVPK